MSKGLPGEIIVFDFLVRELGMTDDEVSRTCTGLEQQGYIEWPGGDVLEITALGIQAIESSGQKPPARGDTYNLNIENMQGGVQQGSGNVQNIQLNITPTGNSEFDGAIKGLLELVRQSELQTEEIDELQEEVVRLNKLALSESKPGLLEKAKARIDFVKLGLQGTDVLIKAAPYLETVWNILKLKFKLS